MREKNRSQKNPNLDLKPPSKYLSVHCKKIIKFVTRSIKLTSIDLNNQLNKTFLYVLSSHTDPELELVERITDPSFSIAEIEQDL